MKTLSTRGNGNVHAVVDQNARSGACCDDRFTRKLSKRLSGQILLSNLNPIYARSQDSPNYRREVFAV